MAPQQIMIFDVETTGFIRKRVDNENSSLENQPHILQLSFVIYNTSIQRVVKSVDLYIRVDPEVYISQKITEITGITKDLCERHGVPIHNALVEFYHEYMRSDCIVAHNLDFDREMIKIEMERNREILEMQNCPRWRDVFCQEFEKKNGIATYCTMKAGKNVCKILRKYSRGSYYKNPKLSELYYHFFQMVPNNLHNSIVDTYTCMMCYLQLQKLQNITIPVD